MMMKNPNKPVDPEILARLALIATSAAHDVRDLRLAFAALEDSLDVPPTLLDYLGKLEEVFMGWASAAPGRMKREAQ
jgi:P2-related tail formation protein